MARASYADQLKDPRWQKRRLEVLQAGDWKCRLCGSGENTLHVHHKQYFKGRMAWEYEDDFLEALCEACHDREHAMEEVLKSVLALNSHKMSGNAIALGLVAGFMSGMGTIHEDFQEPAEGAASGCFHLGVLASLFLTNIEGTRAGMAQVQTENEVQRRALAWLSRGKDGTDQNDKA